MQCSNDARVVLKHLRSAVKLHAPKWNYDSDHVQYAICAIMQYVQAEYVAPVFSAARGVTYLRVVPQDMLLQIVKPLKRDSRYGHSIRSELRGRTPRYVYGALHAPEGVKISRGGVTTSEMHYITHGHRTLHIDSPRLQILRRRGFLHNAVVENGHTEVIAKAFPMLVREFIGFDLPAAARTEFKCTGEYITEIVLMYYICGVRVAKTTLGLAPPGSSRRSMITKYYTSPPQYKEYMAYDLSTLTVEERLDIFRCRENFE